MANLYTYDALHDQDCNHEHDYHVPYLHNYAPCEVCGSPTQETCIICGKPHDHHCLFNIHLPEKHDDDPPTIEGEWGPEPVETYEFSRACLACFIGHEGHPPYSWGWPNHRVFAYAAPHGVSAINKGSYIPAGDLDAWASDPRAAKLIQIHYWDDPQGQIWPRNLDAFESLSLLAWMTAWQSEIKAVAAQASATLVRYHNKSLSAAREADRGYIDYSQYE